MQQYAHQSQTGTLCAVYSNYLVTLIIYFQVANKVWKCTMAIMNFEQKKRSLSVDWKYNLFVAFILTATLIQGCKNQPYTVFDAAYEGDIEKLTKFIEEEGVSVDSKDGFGMALVFHAASSEQLKVLEYLYEKGADLKVKSGDQSTLLHIAAGAGSNPMMEFLLKSGADIDAVDVNGESPLMFAVLSEQPEAITFLVKNGANADLKNASGRSPRSLAKTKKLEQLLGQESEIESPEKP